MIPLDKIINNPKVFLYTTLTYLLKHDSSLILPELFYVFDIKDSIKFLKLFGGRKINIPTTEELYNSIKEIIIIYLKIVEGKTEEEIKSMLQISGHQMRYINERIVEWEKFLKESDYLSVEDLKKFEGAEAKMRGNS